MISVSSASVPPPVAPEILAVALVAVWPANVHCDRVKGPSTISLNVTVV